jgi:AcrR family transcriptional regulator
MSPGPEAGVARAAEAARALPHQGTRVSAMALPAKAQRRDAILDAAGTVLAEQGLAATRISDVAKRVGISPGHVLYYFESKADLFMQSLRTVEERLREEALARFEQTPSAGGRWNVLLDIMSPSGPGDFKLALWLEAWEMAHREPQVGELVAELEDRWQALQLDVLRQARADGELDAEADLEDFVTCFSAFFDGLTIQVVTGSRVIDRERMLQITRQYAADRLGWQV